MRAFLHHIIRVCVPGIAALGIVLCANVLMSQPLQNFRSKSITAVSASDTLWLDSLPLNPNSVIVLNQGTMLQRNTDYRITEGLKPGILIVNPAYFSRQLEVRYRLLNYDPGKAISRYNASSNVNLPGMPGKPAESGNKEGGLKVLGNISRAIGVGNNQDLTLNSNLNLQLNGKLSNGVQVSAVISDDNNPIQPEGNTAQLQDFDKVYVQLMKNRTRLILGDVLMQNDTGNYFIKYYKKSRGMQFNTSWQHNKTNYFTNATAAVSRGRFARNEIKGIEGVQGPYRLQGVNGELFMVIISNTEVVYLDGVRMQRGIQNDYVVDYNSGEITFMPKHLITAVSRIVVEFQYADRNYNRSVYNAFAAVRTERSTFRFNVISEQDLRNQPLVQSLDLYDSSRMLSARDILTGAGDNKDSAVITGVRSNPGFDSKGINYIKIDSAGFTFYRYAPEGITDTVYYRLVFTLMGQGKGNYRLARTAANGKVYEWVAPVGGQPAGDYEPVVYLAAPRRLRMASIGAETRISRNWTLEAEAVSSSNDQNTFSEKDNRDNAGYGLRATLKNEVRGDKGKLFRQQLHSEWIDAGFRSIERYRSVEFDRSWNRRLENPSTVRTNAAEQWMSYSAQMQLPQKYRMGAEAGWYRKESILDALRGVISGEWQPITKMIISCNAEGIQSSGTQDNRSLLLGAGIRGTGTWQPSFNWNKESSRFSAPGKDSAIAGSFGVEQYRLGLVRQQQRSSLSAEAWLRHDDQPLKGELSAANKTWNASVNWNTSARKSNNRFGTNLSYRKAETRNSSISVVPAGETYLGRIDAALGAWKNSVSGTLFSQWGTGREQKRQYTYVEVPAGNGVYAWVDYNGNGLKELNEFEIASFRDQARYIRLFQPTNEFINSRTNDFNQTLTLKSPAEWAGKSGLRKWLSRFESYSVLNLMRKITSDRLLEFVNPFSTGYNDTSLIYNQRLWRSTVFANRGAAWGGEYTYQENISRNLLSNGLETRLLRRQNLSGRANVNTSWSFVLSGESGRRNSNSEFFANNNFEYRYRFAEPMINWQNGFRWRFSLSFRNAQYRYSDAGGNGTAANNRIQLDTRWSSRGKSTFEATGSLSRVGFSGEASSPLAFDMLQGLRKGDNYLWRVTWRQRITGNMQLDLVYEGRKIGELNAIHSGRAEMRYIF